MPCYPLIDTRAAVAPDDHDPLQEPAGQMTLHRFQVALHVPGGPVRHSIQAFTWLAQFQISLIAFENKSLDSSESADLLL